MARIFLAMNGKRINTLDDLRANFNGKQMLDFFRAGRLQKWLEELGEHDLLETVKDFESENYDDETLLSMLMAAFELDEKTVSGQISVQKQEKEKQTVEKNIAEEPEACTSDKTYTENDFQRMDKRRNVFSEITRKLEELYWENRNKIAEDLIIPILDSRECRSILKVCSPKRLAPVKRTAPIRRGDIDPSAFPSEEDNSDISLSDDLDSIGAEGDALKRICRFIEQEKNVAFSDTDISNISKGGMVKDFGEILYYKLAPHAFLPNAPTIIMDLRRQILKDEVLLACMDLVKDLSGADNMRGINLRIKSENRPLSNNLIKAICDLLAEKLVISFSEEDIRKADHLYDIIDLVDCKMVNAYSDMQTSCCENQTTGNVESITETGR